MLKKLVASFLVSILVSSCGPDHVPKERVSYINYEEFGNVLVVNAYSQLSIMDYQKFYEEGWRLKAIDNRDYYYFERDNKK